MLRFQGKFNFGKKLVDFNVESCRHVEEAWAEPQGHTEARSTLFREQRVENNAKNYLRRHLKSLSPKADFV